MPEQPTILVFAGAGASRALGEEYPTTVKFWERYKSDLQGKSILTLAHSFLADKLSSQGLVDVEHVLWALHDLASFLQHIENQETFVSWMFNRGDVGLLMEGQCEPTKFIEMVRRMPNFLPTLRSAIGEIERAIYELYGREPTPDALGMTWIPMLEGVQGVGRVELATTNYDNVLEIALQHIEDPKPDTGHRERKGSVKKYMDTDLWIRRRDGQALLTKLHGSVDWSRYDGDNTVYCGDTHYKGHNDHVVLYPGFKGSPEDPFLRTLHDHFSEQVQRSRVLVFIGFAFRDEYISEILNDQWSTDKTAILLNPAKDVVFPVDHAKPRHVPKNFTRESTEEVIALVAKAINR